MKRDIFKNTALYLLFLLNCASAVRHGMDWVLWVSAALTAAVLALDIREAVKHGR